TTARQAADATLQSNIDSEVSRAQGAEAAEAATRAAADATLSAAISAETSRATGAETTLQSNIATLSASSAKLATGNTFTGNNTFSAKVDMSAATSTLPVQTTNTTPPASGQPSACVSGQMLLQVNGAPGQQLFICNSSLDGWVMVNDDTTSTAA